MILELIDLIKFNLQPMEIKPNAYAIVVAGSEDQIYSAKIGATTLQILGWNSLYIGNVEQHIDPFFDIDLERYITKIWDGKKRPYDDPVFILQKKARCVSYLPLPNR